MTIYFSISGFSWLAPPKIVNNTWACPQMGRGLNGRGSCVCIMAASELLKDLPCRNSVNFSQYCHGSFKVRLT